MSMVILWFILVCMLVVILVASLIFTNALEHFGHKIGFSEGVTGSIFAAVGTALPEMTIPILAMVAGTESKLVNEEISVGAILGAPLMLSTLTICIMTLSVIHRRGLMGKITPEKKGFMRDLDFFLIAFMIAALAMYCPYDPIYLRVALGVLLVFVYVFYLIVTLRDSKKQIMRGHVTQADKPLMLVHFGFKHNLITIYIQLFLGVGLLLIGAKVFINDIAAISKALDISTLLMALVIVPIATELPEKVNSIIWLLRKKDTLALGNITGAMVCQGTVLPALGILLTPWQPTKEVLYGIAVTFFAAAWLRFHITYFSLRIVLLLFNGAFYLIYLYLVI